MRVVHLLSADNAISDISLRRIRISRFRDLNDPFELLAARTDEKIFSKGLRSWGDDHSKKDGLMCFSKHWNNPVLWSHYASKHRGICLGFDIHDKFLEEVKYAESRRPIKFQNDDPEQGLDEQFVLDLLRTQYIHWSYEKEWRVFVKLDPTTLEAG